MVHRRCCVWPLTVIHCTGVGFFEKRWVHLVWVSKIHGRSRSFIHRRKCIARNSWRSHRNFSSLFKSLLGLSCCYVSELTLESLGVEAGSLLGGSWLCQAAWDSVTEVISRINAGRKTKSQLLMSGWPWVPEMLQERLLFNPTWLDNDERRNGVLMGKWFA